MTALPTELANLSAGEKLELINLLWESIDDADDSPLTPAQEADLTQRLEVHRLNPERAIPWEQVEAELLSEIDES
jgi:putative addiction module component (TIGR02574 family)